MFFLRLFRTHRSRAVAAASHRPPLMVEGLESRWVPAILLVDPSSGSAYANISSAFAASTDGDTIQVAPGTYSGSQNTNLFVNKDVTIESVAGAVSTVVDLGSEYFVTTYTAGVTIRGFTLQNGTYSAPISINADATIENCIFQDNTSGNFDASGIYVNNGTTTIQNCVFRNNDGFSALSASGGSFNVIDSLFDNNSQFSGGGAISVNTSFSTISGCTFVDNESTNRQGGRSITGMGRYRLSGRRSRIITRGPVAGRSSHPRRGLIRRSR